MSRTACHSPLRPHALPSTRRLERSLLCLLALLLAAPLLAAPPAPTPHPTMVLQVGHTGDITAFAYSPDGQTLATGGDDGVRLWDAASGHVRAILTYAGGPLAFSPDGRTLASGGQDYTAQLSDVTSGQLKASLKLDCIQLDRLAFSPNGRTLATGEVDDSGCCNAVQLWDVSSGQVRSIPELSVPYFGSFALSADGRTLATGGLGWDGLGGYRTGPVELWDVGSGQPKAGFDGAVGAFAFSPDGQTLATGSGSRVQLWDVASGQLKATLADGGQWGWLGYNPWLPPLAFSPDGRTLAVRADADWSVVQLWDVASKQVEAILRGPTARVKTLAFSPDGQTLATGSDGTVQLWDVASGQIKATLDAGGPLAFSPDGKTLATQGQLWDVASGQLKGILEPSPDVVYGVALSPDGQTLATGDYVGSRLWDTASGQLKATLRGPAGSAHDPSFSPDGQTLATGSYNYTARLWTVQLWDVASGQLKATLPLANASSRPGFGFSPDSRTLATETESYNAATNIYTSTVQLWDVASGQLKATLAEARSPVFSPDGKTLATEIYNATTKLYTTVGLWDVASGQLKATLKDAAPPFAFSPDGETLATGDYDAKGVPVGMRLWDVASGQLKAALKGAYNPAFSPDSKVLATHSANDAQLWGVATGQLKATLKDAGAPLAFSADGKTLATRDAAGQLHLWDVASASPILITAQTSLAQFPPWLTHPFSWSQGEPEVRLLDPVDEHVLATLQALPDTPASLFAPLLDPAAPPTGGNWITTTPDGYFEGSANLAPFIRWSVDGVLYPAAAYWDVYYRPDLVQQALRIPGE